MALFSKKCLSPSGTEGNGKAIAMGSTSAARTQIHRGSTTTTTYDEVWLYATNNGTTAQLLTIEWGGTTDADTIEITIPAASGPVLVAPGLILRGVSGTALDISGYGPSSSTLAVFGYVNRITA